MKTHLLAFLILLAVAIPAVSLAQQAGSAKLIPCSIENAFTECTFEKLFGIYGGEDDSLFGRVYKFIVFKLAVPVATIAILVAGLMMATSQGDPGKRSKAKTILQYAVVGLIITLASYLIIKTIVNTLVENNEVGSKLKLK
ncbi:MAG: hypothetical protein KBC48_02680 [Candidatus Pacebacteria bacterium]|nr:hypothetical protein [Candidatus Paceibacterota bacterium]